MPATGTITAEQLSEAEDAAIRYLPLEQRAKLRLIVETASEAWD